MSFLLPRAAWLLVAIALQAIATGCADQPPFPVLSADSTAISALLEGRARAPARLLDHSARLRWAPAAFGLLAFEETGIISALAYLGDPAEQFHRFNGKMITTTTDAQGRYRFTAGVPKQQAVWVNVLLPNDRRVVGYTVPEAGLNRLDVSVASTLVAEFLRGQAALPPIGKLARPMADYDLARLPDLIDATERALATGALAEPDLTSGRSNERVMAYALAAGQNIEGLGDRWAAMLGFHALASVTIAGTGVAGDGGDGRPASQGEFYGPAGVCVDRAGDIFVADEGNHRVRKIDAQTGIFSTVAGTGDRGFSGDGGLATLAQLDHPRAVILDRSDNLIIFDSANARVRRVERASGQITTIAGNPTPRGVGFWESGHGGDGGPAIKCKLAGPRGGAFDSQGNLYVVDTIAGSRFHTLRKITPAGEISTYAGTPETAGAFFGENVLADKAKLNFTNQIWITPGDQLYLADTFNHCIRKIDLATHLITTVAGRGGQPGGGPEPDGKPATEARLNRPYGVAVDGRGQIVIAEEGNNRLVIVKVDGRMSTMAGGGIFPGDGDARQQSYASPHDLAFESTGNLLMTDTRQARLRRLMTRFVP